VRWRPWLRSDLGLILFAAVAIGATCFASPRHPQLTRFGDDVEYLLVTQSLVRHGSPEYQAGDEGDVLAQLPPLWRRSAALKYQPRPWGYFQAKDGRWLSWHFFTYSAAVAPLKAILDRHGLGWRAFHFTNLAFFCAALLAMLQLRHSLRLWLVLLPLAFLTPALWFLPLAHTEAFVFALGLIATACWLAERPLLAILFNSIAATQFQPLALISLYLAGVTLWGYRGPGALRKHGRAIVACCAVTAIAFVPNAFYLWQFGTGSLVTSNGFADRRLMSFDKLASLFVDLNTGMLVYLPGVLLLWLWSVGSAARDAVRTRSIAPLLLPAAILFTFYATTSARIWNYHTQGIARYALYCTPALLLGIGVQLKAAARMGWVVPTLVVIGLGLQSVVHHEFGWFGYRGNDNLHHNKVAMYVLERWPKLYAPPPEIFCSRTLHKRCWIELETGQVERGFLPVLMLDDRWSAIKGLTLPCEPEGILKFMLFTPEQKESVQAAARRCEKTGARAPMYLNFR
jgi:hypothetical protein